MKQLPVRPDSKLVVDVSSCKGGTHHKSTVISEEGFADKGLVTQRNTVSTKDNVEIITLHSNFYISLKYIYSKYCNKTPFGWYTDKEGYEQLVVELEKKKEETVDLNALAMEAGSESRVYVGWVPANLDFCTEEAVKQINKMIYDTLLDLKLAVKEARFGSDWYPLVSRTKNLLRLTTGVMSDSIRFAIQNATEARSYIKKAEKRNETEESAAKTVNLDSLDAAIDMFDPHPTEPDSCDEDPAGEDLPQEDKNPDVGGDHCYNDAGPV